MKIEIKIWWKDPKVRPTTYDYSSEQLAVEHWKGFCGRLRFEKLRCT